MTKAALGGRAIQRAVTTVKFAAPILSQKLSFPSLPSMTWKRVCVGFAIGMSFRLSGRPMRPRWQTVRCPWREAVNTL